jgi:acyl carrier protein
MDNQQRIIQIVQSVSKKKTVPDPEESLFDSGYLDSFALPDMVGDLEKEFGIKIPDSDLNPRKFDTIERILQYVACRS